MQKETPNKTQYPRSGNIFPTAHILVSLQVYVYVYNPAIRYNLVHEF